MPGLSGKRLEKANRVLEGIMEGRSLREICGENRNKDEIPGKRTFLEWVRDNESLQTAYLAARAIREEVFFDEIIAIADRSGEPRSVDTHECIQRDKLRIDSRKWILSRMNAKKYGDISQREIDEDTGKPTPTKTIEMWPDPVDIGAENARSPNVGS